MFVHFLFFFFARFLFFYFFLGLLLFGEWEKYFYWRKRRLLYIIFDWYSTRNASELNNFYFFGDGKSTALQMNSCVRSIVFGWLIRSFVEFLGSFFFLFFSFHIVFAYLSKSMIVKLQKPANFVSLSLFLSHSLFYGIAFVPLIFFRFALNCTVSS